MSNHKDIPPMTDVSECNVINEHGEESPITDEMVVESMSKIKLESIGAHTGFTKAITDQMIADAEPSDPQVD